MTTPPDRSAPLLVLRVPRAIPVAVLAMAAVWSVPLVAALVSGRPVSPGFQVLNGVIALGLLAFGGDTALIRAVLTAEGVTVRRGLRTRSLSWDQVKGIALLQDGGTPQLRLVTYGGAVSLPAWSLQARHPDGEAEPAAAALARLPEELGVKVRIRTLGGQPLSR